VFAALLANMVVSQSSSSTAQEARDGISDSRTTRNAENEALRLAVSQTISFSPSSADSGVVKRHFETRMKEIEKETARKARNPLLQKMVEVADRFGCDRKEAEKHASVDALLSNTTFLLDFLMKCSVTSRNRVSDTR
jgi:hypothetical protein